MRLANVKVPEELETAIKDSAARLGVSRSVIHRAALRAFLSSDPSREEALRLDGAHLDDLRGEGSSNRAATLLESL